MPPDKHDHAGASHPRFESTRWSVVLAAGAGAGDESRRALAVLCQAYWYPIYAFLRRAGRSAEEACDLTQGYDFGESNGLYFFVMEFVDGANLRDMIRTGNIKPEEALAW